MQTSHARRRGSSRSQLPARARSRARRWRRRRRSRSTATSSLHWPPARAGPSAASAIQSQAGLEYLARDDAYYLKASTGGVVTRINAETFDATAQATTGPTPPDAVNGVYNRWRYLPLLRGFVYLPSGSTNFWFLATAP